VKNSMRSKKIVVAVLSAVLGIVSCRTDPDVAKKRYLESGNRYYDKAKYKEARIMYKDALQKDKRYGPAWYRLGLTALKLGTHGEAVSSLRRAVELLPMDQPDRWDAVAKMADLFLQYGRDQKSLIDEVEKFSSELLKHDPNSFDGHRIAADLSFFRAMEAVKAAKRTEAMESLDAALKEYNRANEIKPNQVGVLMQLARTYGAKQDFATAETLYKKVIETDHTSQTAYTELYRLYVFQKKYEPAEGLLKSAFQANPKQYVFLTSLAMHYSMLGRREDMVKTLQQIKSHAAEYDQAYLVVGDFYLRLGDGETAMREYREGMARDAKRKSTYQKRVIEVLMRQGKRTEAADLNAEILKADPNDTDAKGLAASFLLDKGDVARALAELQAVVTRAPENAVARYNLGRAHMARHEFEQARQSLQKAIELRPDYMIARLELGRLQIARGEYDAALKTAEQVLQFDRGNVVARLLESTALMGQKKFVESRAVLTALAKAYPNAPDVYFQLGLVDLAENKLKDATESFQKSYQLNPANPRGLLGVVEAMMAQNHPEQAQEMLRKETDKAPNNLDLRMALANIYVRAGKYDDAVGEFQKILNTLDKDSKQRGNILMRLGEVYRRKGDYGSAINNLKLAREILPQNTLILSTLALSLDHTGNWSEAKQFYEASIKLDSNNAVALNNLAFLMVEHGGDLEDALSKAQRAKQLMPNLPEVSDTLGWIYLKKGIPEQAVDIFKDLVQKAPTQSTFRYHLGMALSQKGDKTRAIKELQEALRNNPTSGEKQQIQDLLSKLNG
jgi:tetratricopeptide (TPR) repeat protein